MERTRKTADECMIPALMAKVAKALPSKKRPRREIEVIAPQCTVPTRLDIAGGRAHNPPRERKLHGGAIVNVSIREEHRVTETLPVLD